MRIPIPETLEEAKVLQERLHRTYQLLVQARQRDKSLRFRERLAQQYARGLDAMLNYKRAHRGS